YGTCRESEPQYATQPVPGHRDRVTAGLERPHHCPFLVRGHPAEDAFLKQHAQSLRVFRQIPRIDRVVGTGYLGTLRDSAASARTITGELKSDTLRREVSDHQG